MIKKRIYILFAVFTAFFVAFNFNVNASTDEVIEHKRSNYILPYEKMTEMINTQGRLVEVQGVEKPKGYEHFYGYETGTWYALYSKEKPKENEMPILSASVQASANATVVNKGTWRTGGYYGVTMFIGNYPGYCGDYGKVEPIGNASWKITESITVKKALSHGYPVVKSGTNTSYAQYGKTQLGLWKGQGKVNPSASTLGVYDKVSQAYKGKIGANEQIFKITANLSPSTIQNGLNTSANTSISGNVSFGFSTATLNSLKSKGVYPYIYHKVNKKWLKVTTTTKYSAVSFSLIRFVSANMTLNTTISNITVETTKVKLSGYIYDNGKTGSQRIFMMTEDPNEQFKVSMKFNNQTANALVPKTMDDNDLYESDITDNEGNTLFITDDYKPVHFIDEDVALLSIKIPTKEVMDKDNLYGQNIVVKMPQYDKLTKEIQKLDENKQPILKVDENGVNPGEANYIETFEMETVPDLTEDGIQKAKAKRDAENSPIYENITLNIKYPTAEEIKNIYIAPAGKVKFKWFDSNKKEIGIISSNAKGQIIFPNAVLGKKYYYQEWETMPNFKLDKTMREFTVTKANTTLYINNNKAIVNFANGGTHEIFKYDENKKLVPGTVFEIYKQKDGVCDSSEIVTTVTTGEDGKASFKYYANKYCYKETLSSSNLKLSDELVLFDVLDGETTTSDFINKFIKNKVKFLKKDEKTKENLAGATFKLKAEVNGKLTKDVMTFVSKKEAIEFDITGEYKRYCIVEAKAPNGYSIGLKDTECFDVTDDGKVHEITMYNQKNDIVKAGFSDMIIKISSGLVLIFSFAFVNEITGGRALKWVRTFKLVRT